MGERCCEEGVQMCVTFQLNIRYDVCKYDSGGSLDAPELVVYAWPKSSIATVLC